MKYLSSFYWQQEEPAVTSLVLQQFIYRKEKKPGLFACICKGHAYYAQRLNYWFQSSGRRLWGLDNRKASVRTRKSLERLFSQLDCEARSLGREGHKLPGEEIDVIGLICQEERFLLFFRGTSRAYLLNRRFGRSHYRALTAPDADGKLQMIDGSMEEGIALLLATADFCEKLTGQQLEECLSVQEMTRTENIKGRLRELGEEAERKGGMHMGAVLLLTDAEEKW